MSYSTDKFAVSISEQVTAESSRKLPGYKDRRSVVRDVLRSNDVEDVILFDGDADGLGAASLLNEFYTSTNTVGIPIGGSGHYLDLQSVLEILLHMNSVSRVFIVDYCLDEAEKKKYHLMEMMSSVDFYLLDHHSWTNTDTIEYFQTHCEYFELDEYVDQHWEYDTETYEERCTTQMVADFLESNGIRIPSPVKQKITTVAVVDLWITDENEEYIIDRASKYGHSADHLAFHMNPPKENWFGFEQWISWFASDTVSVSAELERYAEKQKSRVQLKLEHITDNWESFVSSTESGSTTVYAVYGNIDPNKMAKLLRQEYNADVCLLLRPNGYCSVRGSETYTDCDTLCARFSGGGHEKAGGFALDNAVPDFNRTEYKNTNGQTAREYLLSELF